MSYYQGNDLRLVSGGLKSPHRGKRKYELGGPFTAPTVGEQTLVRVERVRGGRLKLRVVKADHVNVVDPAGKVTKTKILGVERTPANLEYARRGIVIKGAIVKTQLGLVRISSRPGRDGTVNGVLVEESKS
ncbi:30S ribosomal protein S8e [Candidatus Marsarchaeota G2 archaeon OSP_D]|jgi:small subunit ribosomal protein S8e|uniref:Small ribosomal subunit protein eS8 n=7 Tax=Candidatus Marsarchaeota group 2 TaxID=2203771 RepID=A0A2R6BT94_9ARCH|nr:MAG: 30S ribosomal protein S8e [Candidatus Marsarchaeota G2 archaeon OSP_D]PSN91945.1 MAG: 30S ribosomal protein S8e [Candidatus Marsarchaeota G2 archaeon ECH_B_SAG-M15]PSN93910.1 MAG: 30S ribosomal protein S8e [Candidatus Marsarchaeota G2 archaeon ECH_B_SAG-C16]PSN95989.1 MAG: 30S ribosomal protein S8e [Candidatus Marsarchaeota G2 archaeon ECH_B_2]PSO00765.1 MAG: 30S ribosomal protein S8e [Candidatus Marsarchaeota G2 archaeon ECH_B_3]PSO01858.1 MAG: 30S ribosomal protein S8e [Candidatus Ma